MNANTLVRRCLTALTAGETSPGDAELLARFTAGRDPDAFADLVRRHGPIVLAACRRVLGQSADAEDAFQSTFLALARHAGSIRGAAALPAWLHRTALRAANRVPVASTNHRPSINRPGRFVATPSRMSSGAISRACSMRSSTVFPSAIARRWCCVFWAG